MAVSYKTDRNNADKQPVTPMTTVPSSVLVGQQVLYSNSLATVTEQWIIIRDYGQQSHTIVSLASVSNVTVVKITHIPLVVFASGFFIVAAAAQYSKEGGGAGIPCALIGVWFLIACLGFRRASVTLDVDSGSANTAFGTVAEATKLTAAIRSAREQPSPSPIRSNDERRVILDSGITCHEPHASSQSILH